MKERPILFKPEMVQAILDGSKTMTRRVVKKLCKGYKGNDFFDCLPEGDRAGQKYYYRRADACWDSFRSLEDLVAKRCPYGQVGDRFWVKETWGIAEKLWTDNGWENQELVQFSTKTPQCQLIANEFFCVRKVVYAADGYQPERGYEPGYKSPLFMPRWASRILLEITNVRVERLNDISIVDALAEGIRCPECGYTHKDAQLHMDHAICVNKWLKECKTGRTTNHGAIDAFQKLWESINGKDSWRDNPWLWVIEFKVVQS